MRGIVRKGFHEPVRTFRRGPVATVVGLAHTIVGCLGTIWAVVRITVVGYRAAFEQSFWLGVFSYGFEATLLVLWASGIGLLRGQRWGRTVGAIWAVLALGFHLGAYAIRRHYWGDLVYAPDWGEILLMYYAGIFLAVVFLKKMMGGER